MKLDEQKTLWDLTRGHRARYIAAIVSMGVSNVFLFGVPLVSRNAIDEVADGRPVPWLAAVAIVSLTAGAGAFQYLRGRWAATASEGIARAIRNRLFGHLERLPSAYHDRAGTGDLVQRCTSDVETVRVFLSGQVVEIGRSTLLFVMVVPVLLSMDVALTLVSICLFPLIFLFAVAFFRQIQHLFLLSDEAESAMTTVLQENLTGIRVVRACARQDFECEKFAVKNAAFRDRTDRLIRFLGAYWATSDFLCVAQLFLLLLVGAWWMADGRLSVGTLFAFQLLVNFVLWPVRHLGRVLTDTGKAMVSLRRIREILDVPEEFDPPGASADPERLGGRIEVRDLTFGFDAARPVLSGISFSLQAGDTLALVGPPGSGKSVLVQLLLRLYDYERGSIRFDGRELNTLSRDFVRRRVGVVLQEPFLFAKTLAANIRVGYGDAQWDQIVESSRDAGIHTTIEGFDRGYETLIGERGVTLSGGQRQRVAIARALLKNPDVLVLDDALSAVDTHMEAQILGALQRRRGRWTTIIIAHRLSTVTHAERILVLDRGRVVQAGTHSELVERDGSYRQLWRIQGSLEREVRGLGDADREAAR